MLDSRVRILYTNDSKEDSMAGGGDSTRAIVFALGANFAIAVAKGVAAFFTGSSAMLAETVHSMADCGNQLLLLFGMTPGQAPPCRRTIRWATARPSTSGRSWWR